jgi:pyrimidine operon attenuation protein/uracil phosphoribosyltransferase
VKFLFSAQELSMTLQRVSVDMLDLLMHSDPTNVIFVGILTNGVFFAQRVMKQLSKHGYNIDTPVMSLDISLYRDDLSSKKNYLTVSTTPSMTVPLDDKHVVLFDDVISSARTARAALNAIFDYGRPQNVSMAVLFDRKNRHLPIEPNVVGQVLDVDPNLRVNVGFVEVKGEDGVMTVPFTSEFT